MSVRKWSQSEICTVINDKSQSSIAKHLRNDELLYYTFIIQSAGDRIFFKVVNIWRGYRQNGDFVSCAPFSLHFCPQRCWSRQISWIIWYYGQKVFLIVVMRIGRLMWVYYQQTSNCCRPVLTYWPTDWRHQWLLIMYSILLRQLFFVAAVVYSGSWDFLYGRSCRCKQLFVSELNNAYFSRHYFILKQCLSG